VWICLRLSSNRAAFSISLVSHGGVGAGAAGAGASYSLLSKTTPGRSLTMPVKCPGTRCMPLRAINIGLHDPFKSLSMPRQQLLSVCCSPSTTMDMEIGLKASRPACACYTNKVQAVLSSILLSLLIVSIATTVSLWRDQFGEFVTSSIAYFREKPATYAHFQHMHTCMICSFVCWTFGTCCITCICFWVSYNRSHRLELCLVRSAAARACLLLFSWGQCLCWVRCSG
jgi:hypothetical protein